MNNMLIFMDALSTPVFWLDRNKVYQGCNQVFSDLMGLNVPSDIIGLTDKDLPYSSEDLHIRDDIFNSILKNQSQAKILYDCIVAFEDKMIWVQKRFTPLKNHKGKIIGVLGSVVDISEKVNRRKEMDTYIEHKNLVRNFLGDLNTTPILSTKYQELIEKSIRSLQKESQASLAVFLKENARSSKSFFYFTTDKVDAEECFKNRNILLKALGQSGYLDAEAIKGFLEMGKPIETVFYYRIKSNDFVKYDDLILLINPNKDKIEAASTYLALTHHLIRYFHVGKFLAATNQVSQHFKNGTEISKL